MDRDDLKDWLNTRPREDAILIAQRATLRVFPFWASAMGQGWARAADLNCTLVLRCLLTAGVARQYPTPQIRFAAASARYALSRIERVAAQNSSGKALILAVAATALASHDDTAAAQSAFDATSSASAAFAANSANWSDFFGLHTRLNSEQDIAVLRAGDDLLNLPLWHEDIPEPIQSVEPQALQNLTHETGDPNSFWHRWWRGAVSGQWLDWNLQREVALIPDDIWQQGPKAVMVAIAEIEARYALALTDNAETIEPDPETGRLILVPTSSLPPDLGHYARRKILKAVALVDDPACLQMYGGLSADLAMLRDAVTDAENMPVELYDSCASATRRLAVRAANGECPLPDKDAVLSDYLTRLREVAADILSHDPATQSVLERRNAITGNAGLIDSAVVVRQATTEVLPVTAGHLANSLPKDAALATDPSATAEDRKAAAFRWAGRFLRIGKFVGGAVAGAGASVVLAKEVVEALPIIQASPYYQQAMAAILRWLGLG